MDDQTMISDHYHSVALNTYSSPVGGMLNIHESPYDDYTAGDDLKWLGQSSSQDHGFNFAAIAPIFSDNYHGNEIVSYPPSQVRSSCVK